MGLRSRWAAGAWVRTHRLHGQEQGTALQLCGGGPGPLRALSAKGGVCAGQTSSRWFRKMVSPQSLWETGLSWWHCSGGLEKEQRQSRANRFISSPLLILKQMGNMLANKNNKCDEKLAHMDAQRGMVWGIFFPSLKKINHVFVQKISLCAPHSHL